MEGRERKRGLRITGGRATAAADIGLRMGLRLRQTHKAFIRMFSIWYKRKVVVSLTSSSPEHQILSMDSMCLAVVERSTNITTTQQKPREKMVSLVFVNKKKTQSNKWRREVKRKWRTSRRERRENTNCS